MQKIGAAQPNGAEGRVKSPAAQIATSSKAGRIALMLLLVLASCGIAVEADAQPVLQYQPPSWTPYEGPVTTTPTAMWTVTGPSTRGRPVYQRVWNVSPAGSSTLWCSRYTAAGAVHPSPGPGVPGSYPLAPGAYEEFSLATFVPPPITWCASDANGTAQVAVEVY